MIVTKMYKRLTARLKNTREHWWAACEDLGIDHTKIDPKQLPVQQCTHCDLWTDALIQDLDANPICYYCKDLAGM